MVGAKKSRRLRSTDKSLNVLNSMKSNKAKKILSLCNDNTKTKCSKKSIVLKDLDINKEISSDKSNKKQPKITNFLIPGKENLKSARPKTRQFYKNNLEKPENVKTDCKENCIPIWKTLKNVSQLKNIKDIDVYDISQDEEMACEAKFTKKMVKKTKNSVKKRTAIKKSKIPRVKSATNSNSLTISKPENQKTWLKVVDQNENSELDFQVETNHPFAFPKSGIPPVCNISKAHPVNSTLNDVSFQLDKETFLSQLADEIEKSFLIPQMTSTPTEVRTKPQNCQSDILGQSYLQTIVVDQAKEPPEIQNKKAPVDKDIILFESPVKNQKVPKKKTENFESPVKHNRSCLFKENYDETSAEIEPEVSISAAKSYHTPDNFKTHLVRTKNIIAADEKCLKKKSKEELEIEKIVKHFEEVEETELCIER